MRVLSGLLCLPLLVMGQEKIKWQKDGSQMALIPSGSFEMDDTEPDGSQCNFADKNAPEKFGHADRGLVTAINIPHIQPMATVCTTWQVTNV